MIAIYAQRADGSFAGDGFLIDTGADRTIFSGRLFQALGLPALPTLLGRADELIEDEVTQ